MLNKLQMWRFLYPLDIYRELTVLCYILAVPGSLCLFFVFPLKIQIGGFESIHNKKKSINLFVIFTSLCNLKIKVTNSTKQIHILYYIICINIHTSFFK